MLGDQRACSKHYCLLLQALGTKEATVTPLWKGLWVMLKYRTSNNYRSCAPALRTETA